MTPHPRRTVVKGIAWSVPVVAFSAPVVAYAASGPVLGGLMDLSRNNSGGTCSLVSGGTGGSVYVSEGSTSNVGTWVTDTQTTTTITGLTITLWLPATWATVSIDNRGGLNWSNVTSVTATRPTGVPADYVAYRTSYTGTWSRNATTGAMTTTTRQDFTLNRSTSCSSATSTVYVERTAVIDGQTQTSVNTRSLTLN